MSFLFVDHILNIEPGYRAQGIKHVTSSDAFLAQDANGRFHLFDSIVAEAIGQLAAWSILKACDFTLRPVAGVFHEVLLLDHAYVGDTIELQAHIHEWDEAAVSFEGKALVDDKVIAHITQGLGPMLPLVDFHDPMEVQHQYERLFVERHQVENTVIPVIFDEILSYDPLANITGQKRIDGADPYFKDHFPRKPVFPMSLLMHCNLTLAAQLVPERYQPTRLYKIKMSDFVQPGDVLKSECTIKKKMDEVLTVVFQSFVNDKRVCTAFADFKEVT